MGNVFHVETVVRVKEKETTLKKKKNLVNSSGKYDTLNETIK